MEPNEAFNEEKTCVYKEETYSVRDNGAIFRHKKEGKRKRRLDEIWTFGNKSESRGYMLFSSEAVHRIVATAFHGPPPSAKHVIDHKDTNKCNNRPENLHWLTRLENILLNPVTRRRIELAYGSIEEFFKDPSKPKYKKTDPGDDWMRTVTKAESDATRERLLKWAESGKESMGGRLGDWIYSKQPKPNIPEPEPEFINSLTPGVLQKKWKTPTEFPLVPPELSLETYQKNLQRGMVFSKNQYVETKVVEIDQLGNDALLIVGESPKGTKPWSVAKVYIINGKLVHESMGSFFEKNGAMKKYYNERDLEWTGGDSIDEYF